MLFRSLDGSFELTLLLALHAVSLTFICLCHFFLLSSPGHAGNSRKARSNTLTIPREARITRSFLTRGMDFLRSITHELRVRAAFVPFEKGTCPVAIAESVEEILEIGTVVRDSQVDQLVDENVVENILRNPVKSV